MACYRALDVYVDGRKQFPLRAPHGVTHNECTPKFTLSDGLRDREQRGHCHATAHLPGEEEGGFGVDSDSYIEVVDRGSGCNCFSRTLLPFTWRT